MAKRKQQRRSSSPEAGGEASEPEVREPIDGPVAPVPAPTQGSDSPSRGLRRTLRMSGGLGTIVTIAVALGLALAIQAFVVKPYKIPSGSMEPTLDIGQRILANRFIYHFEDPSIGDIVVFHPPVGADRPDPTEMAERASTTNDLSCGVQRAEGAACSQPIEKASSQNFIKRIVAGPGDTLSIREGHPVVNGVEKKDEPYIRPCGSQPQCNLPRTIRIPPDHYFVMGDNRGGSFDSRFWGPVPRDWIIGEAFATYWPIDRIGLF
jgi:signal peptidase I